MSSNVVIVLSTGEKEKALTGLLYAVNAQKNNWLENVKVIFFGPFENLVCEDEDVMEAAFRLKEYQTPVACKFLSDRDGISAQLDSLGFNVDYVGSMLSDFIKKGYTPMVF